jgi:hypothetical protein
MAKKKPAPTAPSSSQDAYATNLGRYFGGVGLAPAAPPPPKSAPPAPAATVGPPQGADIYNPAGAKTPKPVTTEGGVKISAQETAKFNPASPVYEETPRGEMSAEKQAAIAARIRREELARTGIGSDSLAAFVNTLKLLIGEKEASQPYITKLFQVQNAYTKAGYTSDEALNLTLKDARNLPELAPFKNRFKAIFAIEDLKAQGKYNPAIPTIKEYIESENALLVTLNTAGLTDLATQESVADFFSTGKSVKEITEIVDTAYQSIRKAPKSVRDILQKDFSSVTDAQLVKAMVTGKKGVQALQDQIAGANVLGASQEQSTKGLFGMTSDQAMMLAASGETYATTKVGVKNIVGYLPQLQAATLRYKQGQFTDQDAINAEFNQNADALQTIKKSRELEESEFKKKTGLLPSSLRGKGTAGQL